ncbi:tyrosine-type recombinase/integrase [Caballeronia sp. 15715]|uniref:tyrosine-type recombinase/integrase n=1 Tax=Caballeronia sp. 15715 TaxID=3391030 RepID=UPI0039E4D485
MARPIKKLSAVKVRQEKTPGYYSDGGGLYLDVGPTGSKSWIFRYARNKKAHWIGLGAYLNVSLEAARAKAESMRQVLGNGQDPKEIRLSERAKAAAKMTFTQCATAYIEAQTPGWKNAKHAEQWTNTLTTYAAPVIGTKDVALVDTTDVRQILEPIWTMKNETASRVRGRIEKVLAWAATRGLRSGENPARWKGHLDTLLAKPSAVQGDEHHASIPYAEIAGFMESLRAMEGVAAKALEFCIYTAARTNEIIGAQWDEIDLEAKLWTVPAERMKMKKEHRVPLSGRAVAILKAMEKVRQDDFVFPGLKKDKGLSNMSLLAVLKRMERADLTVHGFRSTFRTWAAETTNFPRELAEKALAHAVRSEVEAAYQRGDLLAKRGRMMDAWASYCAKHSV